MTPGWPLLSMMALHCCSTLTLPCAAVAAARLLRHACFICCTIFRHNRRVEGYIDIYQLLLKAYEGHFMKLKIALVMYTQCHCATGTRAREAARPGLAVKRQFVGSAASPAYCIDIADQWMACGSGAPTSVFALQCALPCNCTCRSACYILTCNPYMSSMSSKNSVI